MNPTNPPHWEAPKFSFTTEDQVAEWKKFYVCALDFLESLDIDPEKKDENKKGWRQIKMMFQDDDRQTLQDLIDNNTITAEDQLTPASALQAIQRTLKEDEHFWHFRDELLSDFRQEPNEGIHSLSNRITNLINNCKFTDSNTKETLKLMLLAHAIKYHEARDWIRLQNQNTLTYQTLLAHCKVLEQRCEQFQKAQLKGRAELTTITVAASVTSSVHQDTVTTHKKPNCTRCGYNHPKGSCPASGQQCYNCSRFGHYTALCKKPRTPKQYNRPNRPTSRRPSHRYSSRPATRGNSRSPSRGRSHRSPSRSPHHKQYRSPQHNRRKRRSPTPHIHQVSHITHILPRPYAAEGQLITDRASDGHTSFHTTLQIDTKQGAKSIPVKVDPGAEVNTIPLSQYKKLFKKNFTKAGNIKNNVLHPTSHLWSSHDSKPQQFMGYFITNIHHKTISKTLPVRFYVFQDTTNPPILLSYSASERLGIIEFKVPNEAPSAIAVDTISTTKKVTFSNLLVSGKSTKGSSKSTIKPAIKIKPFQDHTSHTIGNKPSQDQQSSQHPESIKINAFQDQLPKNTENSFFQDHSLRQHSSTINHSFQDHFSTKDVKDVFTLKQAFPTSFDTVGNMSGKYTIRLDPAITPVQHARRKVPIHYKEEIEKTLKEMEQLEIITPVTAPTEWVSSITYPTKPDGSLRICLDPRNLNKAIIREHYKAPTLEEISHRLSGATVFSKLDAKNGFWSIHLDTPSSYLTTFNTHKGRYRILRMPFGLKMSQDVFQMRMDNITERLKGIMSIHDDICVFGKTQQEHDENLLQLMKIAQKHGLVFNSNKCQISKQQITFYGAIFSAKGMKPDPKKVQALQDLPIPQTQKELQSFLGLINYLQPFLPDLSHKTTFLREQISNWDWTPSTDAAFHHLKQWICNTLLKTTLAYYDRTKPVEVHTDASEYGLGAALIQHNKPVAFASKTLTPVESRYANIECEYLSVVFGLEKFHTYIYGNHVTVYNDHKPLEMIQKKPIHAAPPCLQRMLLRLQKYDYNIIYKPGKQMVLADRLSRFPSKYENLPIELHHNIHHVTFTQDKINIIRGSTERDPILHTVYRLTLNGWPTKFHEVPHIAHQYWGTRDELSVENGLLIKGDRICIPPELYERMLHDLHEGHKGIEKMQHLAHDRIYWQGMDADITEYVKNCKICTKHKAMQAVQPMIPRDIPEGPWQDLAADFFHHNNSDYLLITDTFCKYPFLYRVTSKAAEPIILKVKSLISQYGPP